jgi:metal-sulfur cluster biosynthetic enzyme
MTGTAAEAVGEYVTNALRVVIDPELGFNIVDLGLIYCVAVSDDGAVRIAMTTTTRGCPATDYLTGDVREAAGMVPGVASVDVTLVYDPPWRPDMMTPLAAAHLGMGGGARGGR